jgi:hypothetical protein
MKIEVKKIIKYERNAMNEFWDNLSNKHSFPYHE